MCIYTDKIVTLKVKISEAEARTMSFYESECYIEAHASLLHCEELKRKLEFLKGLGSESKITLRPVSVPRMNNVII